MKGNESGERKFFFRSSLLSACVSLLEPLKNIHKKREYLMLAPGFQRKNKWVSGEKNKSIGFVVSVSSENLWAFVCFALNIFQ